MIGPHHLGIAFSNQDGRCKTLDASADGYARGEACVTHLLEHFEQEQLKRAPAAAAIVVHGTAVNQDGRSSSLTVSIVACLLATTFSAKVTCAHMLILLGWIPLSTTIIANGKMLPFSLFFLAAETHMATQL